MIQPPPSLVLLVGANDSQRAAHVKILGPEAGFNIEVADDADMAYLAAEGLRPECVVVDLDSPRVNGLEFCRRVKAKPALAQAVVLVLASPEHRPLVLDALACGIDDYVLTPVDGLELVARVRTALRTRRYRDAAQPLAALAESADQVVALLAYLVDGRRPGAAERGRRLADAALNLAERFQVPPVFRRDLEWAALLHEIGLAVDTESPSGWLDASGWRSLVVASHVLSRVEALRPTADLVSAIAENWDGSGYPDRRQKGQIPLRSRLLRVLIDYYATGSDTEAIRAHAGVWYDPAVVAQVEAVAAAEVDGDRQKWRVPVAALRPGMVLAEDLCTESGVKLLAAGATLTVHSLDVVRRRDFMDPIVDGVWVAPAVV